MLPARKEGMKQKHESIGDPITKLIEECSKLIHILCKVQRFGWFNWHPDDESKKPNIQHVLREIADVEKRIHQLRERMPESKE